MIGQRHEIARFQSDFYRDAYYKMLFGLFGAMAVILALIMVIIYFVFFEPSSNYYVSTTAGLVLPISPA
jgi:uncharacterized membrane protein